jgi:hypothetical protein
VVFISPRTALVQSFKGAQVAWEDRGFCDYAATMAVQIAGIVVSRPGSFADLGLLLPDFCCEFNSADSDRRCLESLKPQHRTDLLLNAAVVWLNSVIKILARRDADSLRHLSCRLQFPNRPMRGRLTIKSDDARCTVPFSALWKNSRMCQCNATLAHHLN